MGRDKAGLPHPTKGTFLTHAIERLQSLCAETCLSGSVAQEVNQIVLPDPLPNRGPVLGITTALSYAKANGFGACLITPIDTPNLQTEDLQLLVDRWKTSSALVVAESTRVEPLIAVYPTCGLESLCRLAYSKNRRLYNWIESQRCETVQLPAKSCLNVNHPGDL